MQSESLGFFRNQIDFLDNHFLDLLKNRQTFLSDFTQTKKDLDKYFQNLANCSYNSITPKEWFLELMEFITYQENHNIKSIPQLSDHSNSIYYSYLKHLDLLIYQILVTRFFLALQIGKIKKKTSSKVIDKNRWEILLNNILNKAQKLNIDAKLIKKIMQKIHLFSINLQKNV